MADSRYYTAVVTDNNDPDQAGRLMLEIPGLLDDPSDGGDAIWPDWIEPRLGGGAGPEGVGLFWVPPVGAIVIVERDRVRMPLRWFGSTLGSVNALPGFLTGNYPKRAGFSSQNGAAVLALDDDTGAYIVLKDADDPENAFNTFMFLGRDRSLQFGTDSGTTVLINDDGVVLGTQDGHMFQLDNANDQIALAHKDGTELIMLEAGVTKINGTAIQMGGGTIELGDGLAPALNPYLLTLAYLADVSLVLAEVIAIGAGIPAGLPVLTPNAIAMQGKIATSLGAGAPYLSTITTGG